MNINQIEAFIAIAKLGSLAKASEEVNATPAALSQRVKQLESRLGAEVFVRTSRGMLLSKHGLKIYDHAVNLIENLNKLGSLKETEADLDPLTIGISTAFSVASIGELLASKSSLWRTSSVRKIGDDFMLDRLVHGAVDIGLSYDSTTPEGISSKYAGTKKFVLVSKRDKKNKEDTISVISPSINELYQWYAHIFAYTSNKKFFHSDCYEDSIRCLVSKDYYAILDSITAERLVDKNPDIMIHEDDLILPFYIRYKSRDRAIEMLVSDLLPKMGCS